MYRKRILIADSDPAIRRFVKTNLEARGCMTFVAMNGMSALDVIESESPDLAILDIMLPVIDGTELCRRIRADSQVPIIVLGSWDEQALGIRCLDLGADDCLMKPFGVEELLARVRAVLRRKSPFASEPTRREFRAGRLQIRFPERRVTVGDREVRLTPTEFSVLQELALNADKVLTHSILLQRIWGQEYGGEREYLRVVVGRLRRKLEPDPKRPDYILTVPWVGYRLSANHEAVVGT